MRTKDYYCKVCHDALDPKSKNCRCNVTALVRHSGYNVLIDCGKTIRETALRHFPRLGVESVDAIVLTHGHADAVLGLDDARDIQRGAERIVAEDGSVTWGEVTPTPVYLNEDTMAVCRKVFPYLLPVEASNKKDISRRVASILWKEYSEKDYFLPFKPIESMPVSLTPIPTLHGGEYICMGFLIHMEETRESAQKVIAYISDLHKLPDRSMQFLKRQPRIDLLVIDMLTDNDRNHSHYSKTDAIEVVRELGPTQAVAVGMTCSLGMHDDVNQQLAMLKEEGINLRLAYDGERFPC